MRKVETAVGKTAVFVSIKLVLSFFLGVEVGRVHNNQRRCSVDIVSFLLEIET